MSDGDGNIFCDVKIISRLLLESWCPFWSKHAGQEDWSRVHEIINATLPANVVVLPPLIGAHLAATIRRMKAGSSLGADAWAVDELRSLLKHPLALERLAAAFMAIEAGIQQWPRHLLEAWVALIPKTGAGCGPQD